MVVVVVGKVEGHKLNMLHEDEGTRKFDEDVRFVLEKEDVALSFLNNTNS